MQSAVAHNMKLKLTKEPVTRLASATLAGLGVGVQTP